MIRCLKMTWFCPIVRRRLMGIDIRGETVFEDPRRLTQIHGDGRGGNGSRGGGSGSSGGGSGSSSGGNDGGRRSGDGVVQSFGGGEGSGRGDAVGK